MITSSLLRACKVIYYVHSTTHPRKETKQQQQCLKKIFLRFAPEVRPDVIVRHKRLLRIWKTSEVAACPPPLPGNGVS